MTVRMNNVQQSIDTSEREYLFNQRRGYGCEEEYLKNRRQWHENPEKHIVSEYPLHIDLELSSVCNLKCPMCYTITTDFKQHVQTGLMDFRLFQKVIDECAANDVFSIRLSLRGEATLHKQFIDCIGYAKKKGIKEVSTLTNGRNLTDIKFVQKIIEAGLDWITVSVDGVSKVYEKIRQPIKYSEIVLALKNLMGVREVGRRMKPAIKIQGVWPAIKKDVGEYIDTFTPLCDLIYVNPLVDYLFQDNSESIEYVPEFTCYQPFQRLVITSSGKALMCANDQLEEGIVGDANTTGIHEIWLGPEMTRLRQAHIDHAALSKYTPCRTCQVPRRRQYEEAQVKERTVKIANYRGRAQEIGR